MADLFQRGGLQQDTGLLGERWQQSDCTQQQAYASAGGTVYSVTSGKKLFVPTLIIDVGGGAANTTVTIKDNATTLAIVSGFDTGRTQYVPLKVPLKFLTSVVCTLSGSSTSGPHCTMSGWEEKA